MGLNVLLAIDQAHTVPQRALDGGSGFSGLTRFMGPVTMTLFPMTFVCL